MDFPVVVLVVGWCWDGFSSGVVGGCWWDGFSSSSSS